MADTVITPRQDERTKEKIERPKLYKVILLNDDYTPREFVVRVLAEVFQMGEGTAHNVMMTAHQKGSCVVAVYTRDVAETKAMRAVEISQREGHPLMFVIEPEE